MKANLILLSLLLAAGGCVKDKEPASPAGNPKKVVFKLNGFRSMIKPFSKASTPDPFTLSSTVPNTKNIIPGPDPQFLYFWSFNGQNLIPDIAADLDGAGITYELNSAVSPGYTLGYHYSNEYIAGYSFSTTGPKSFTINMPAKYVSRLDSFCFDAVSSNTGPKDFEIYYSTDNGITETLLPFNCQFTDFAANKLHRFRFTFDGTFPISAHDLFSIKIVPVAGNRTGHPYEYNPAAGTMRLDNIRLAGVYDPDETGGGTAPEVAAVSKLHYFLFDSNNNDQLVASGSNDFNTANASFDLTVDLTPGTYSAIFISNVSTEELLLPPQITHAEDLYIGSLFRNTSATIFGSRKDDIIVEETDLEETLTLVRLFSKISFEFTDESGLPDIGRLEIIPNHSPFWYTPYGYPGILPEQEAAEISFSNPFRNGETGVSFHQFMGITPDAQPVSYTVTIYDTNDQPIRMFQVHSAIHHNVQLTFTGNLLTATGPSGGFSVSWNTNWDDQLTIPF